MGEDPRLTMRRWDSVEGSANVLERTSLQRVHDVTGNDEKAIVSVHEDATVREALELLTANNVRCAPIGSGGQFGNQYVGLVDKLDILSLLLTQYYTSESPGEVQSYIAAFDKCSKELGTLEVGGVLEALKLLSIDADRAAVEALLPEVDINKNGLVEADEFIVLVRRLAGQEPENVFDQPATEAVGVSATNTLVFTPNTSRIWPVLKRMSQSLPRVMLTQDEDPQAFISQTGMLRYLVGENLLGTCKDKTVRDLKWDSVDPLVLDAKASTHEAFLLLFEKCIPGLAIVKDGKLWDYFSDSSSKTIAPHHLGDLFLSLEHFLEKAIATSPSKCAKKVASVKSWDTLETVAQLLVDRHLHILCVVDDDDKPTGIITLADVLHEVTIGYDEARLAISLSDDEASDEGEEGA